MSVDTLPSSEECNCFAVRAAARHVTQSYDQFLAPTGLRTTQFSILAKLKRKGPLTINALAEATVMDRTTLGRSILPLERDGLIRVEPAASDRRAKDLHLTKAGEKRFLAALKRWSAAQARFDTVFGAKRVRTCVHCCERSWRANSRLLTTAAPWPTTGRM
jgi:DNA-binding MarR family transcriptional regulator